MEKDIQKLIEELKHDQSMCSKMVETAKRHGSINEFTEGCKQTLDEIIPKLEKILSKA